MSETGPATRGGRNGDAFGRQIHDYLHGRLAGEAREIYERDDGWVRCGGHPEGYFAPFQEWPEHQRKAMEHVRGRSLDVGCGAGRVALHLQEKSLAVVGIDNSPLAVRTCQERGVIDARILSITQASASRLGRFDSIVMMGNNFGLFGGPERARRLLRRFHRMTTTQGRIIAETSHPYATEDPIHHAYWDWNRKRGRLPGQIRLRSRYIDLKGPWFDYLFVSKDQMRQLLDGTGWIVSELIDSDGDEYIAVIEKS